MHNVYRPLSCLGDGRTQRRIPRTSRPSLPCVQPRTSTRRQEGAPERIVRAGDGAPAARVESRELEDFKKCLLVSVPALRCVVQGAAVAQSWGVW